MSGRGSPTCSLDAASYEEHAYGTFSGREEIRSWVLETMTAFPGNTMSSFPIAWHVVDAPTKRVICEVRNLMPDPGDGSVHEASNLTILTYGGEGLWSREEDIYNPMRFAQMSRWARVAAEHGRLSAEGQAFLDKMSRPLNIDCSRLAVAAQSPIVRDVFVVIRLRDDRRSRTTDWEARRLDHSSGDSRSSPAPP